ncbi:CDGSH iron-sulfur domain-containing protein [Desulfitobacterium sp.]|uniref:CDGSH iron-sulfur domain-containing protein n=1 Tax=Desulfitobacterium sp. TaxID=49981 RepID=UPI002B20B18B|nr:CDGSH iron-sulfur domain-containing protein [Desulfitobacterium sp.]MEA4900721.1 CDGSH iron-sulfur domain-containing protein [Desulfitobacterium sp.]
MSKVKIQVLDNAPLIVKGDVELLDGEGKTIETNTELHLCRCGLSKNKPYCDGSHHGKFEDKARAK